MKYNVYSLYIHIPFCKHICSYCDFIKVIYNKQRVEAYFKSLFFEFDSLKIDHKLKTIFIGGGTPSCIDLKILEELLKRCYSILDLNDYEFTIECNVEDINDAFLSLITKYGVNRLSVGVQTFNQKYIHYFNRHHNKQMVIDNINLAKKYLNNISIDMIYAITNQTLEELKEDIDIAMSLPITHISYYSLQLEENTPLYAKKTIAISDDIQAKMYELIYTTLKEHDIYRYEISNFAKVGYESKHNLVYWHNEKYYAIGISSSGYLDNIRYKNTFSMLKYCKQEYDKEEEFLSKEDMMFEQIMLNLRLDEGLNVTLFNKLFAVDFLSLYGPQIAKLIENDLIFIEDNKIKTTFRGSLLLDDILVEF